MAFESLTNRLQQAMSKIRRKGKVSEADVKEMMREIRLALLEADVNLQVVKDFTKRVRERAVGVEVLESLSPAQQIVKIVDEELTKTLGSETVELNKSPKIPTVIMMTVDSLTTLFKTLKPVRRAFLCSIKEHADEQPVLLIGIEADGDIDEIIQAAGSVATDTLPGDEPIDICQVKNGEKGISHFITEHIPPVYERRWGGFLRDLKTTRII